MTSQQSLQLFDIVNRNFKSEADARLFVTEIDTLISSCLKDEASNLVTQKDLDVAKTELLKEIAATNKEIVLVKADLTKQMDTNKAELTKQMDANKYELIKWMFSFWVTLILLLVGAFFMKK